MNTSVTQQHQHLEKKKKKGNRSGTEKGPALRKRQTEIQRFVGGSQEHLRQMITLHINPPQLTTHSVPTPGKKKAPFQHIFIKVL